MADWNSRIFMTTLMPSMNQAPGDRRSLWVAEELEAEKQPPGRIVLALA
jgi:hypothetical protein